MKLILIALLMSLGIMAQTEAPMGIYQLDDIHSRIVGFEKSSSLNGHIELATNFTESKLVVEGKNFSFESTEFIGTIENFTVKGMMTNDGLSSNVTLKGQYLGMIHNELKNQAAFKLTNKDLHIRLHGSKPSDSTTALLKEVQNIVE